MERAAWRLELHGRLWRWGHYCARLGLKRNYLKRQGQGSGATGLEQGEMGCDDGPVWEGEMRRGKKSSLTARNWVQRAKGI
jgi:hypothetical protein